MRFFEGKQDVIQSFPDLQLKVKLWLGSVTVYGFIGHRIRPLPIVNFSLKYRTDAVIYPIVC